MLEAEQTRFIGRGKVHRKFGYRRAVKERLKLKEERLKVKKDWSPRGLEIPKLKPGRKLKGLMGKVWTQKGFHTFRRKGYQIGWVLDGTGHKRRFNPGFLEGERILE